uniref:Methionyl-tRNA formyltransferase, mitochondrial n=1 Tax=Globisporangium ultimum (strain ATCC 200006 / CBS 805.95 / DAOM BR144) TaxID=431595 RepID=K3X1H3_GLOUD
MLRRSARAGALLLQSSSANARVWTNGAQWRSFAAASSAASRVLFFGTDDVSVATLKALYANSQQDDGRIIDTIDVICPSDRKVGRGKRTDPVPVKRFALDHGLNVFHTPPQLKTLKNWPLPTQAAYDVGVVVSFGYFLHPHLLANLAHGAINMHPSLLPKYRGPAPIHHALLNGDATTGVSVIEIDPRAFDVGRILLQKEFAIPPEIQCNELSQRLASFGAECVLETLQHLAEYKKNAVVQDDSKACKAPKISFQDGILAFQHETADQIFHKWQALSDSVGISVQFKDKVVKLIEIRRPTSEDLVFVHQEESRLAGETGSFSLVTSPEGTCIFDKTRQALWLKCAANSWLLVTKLQQADRKVGSAIDFANGYRLKHLQREQFHKGTQS